MIPKIAIVTMLLIVLSPAYINAIPGTISVDIDGTPVDIDYDVEGVEIIAIEANMDDIALILQVKVTGSSGIIEMSFDREIFDATFEGQDDDFFIIAEGEFVDDLEEIVTTSETRTLRFVVPPETEEIEIFGTVLAGSTFGEPTEEPPTIEEPPPVEEPPPPVEEQPPTVEEKPPVMEEEKPKTQCGPGTILKDGVCVLEQTCGPGTHLEDGTCVLDETPSASLSVDRSMGTELIIGIVGALIIAFIVMIILWIISRGSRQKQTV